MLTRLWVCLGFDFVHEQGVVGYNTQALSLFMYFKMYN